MKHAFSNLIKIAISKLLAYVVSTFCKKFIAKYSLEYTCDVVAENLRTISSVSSDTYDKIQSRR